MNNAPVKQVSQVELAPPIPSKFEIIPIHASDAATFKRCRRRWEWSSPMNLNLTGKVSQLGVIMPFWFGTGIHYALANYYDPAFKRDPVEAFVSWYDIVWRGGTIGAKELELTYDRNPVKVVGSTREDGPNDMYHVLGLYDLLADPIEEDFEEHKELGINMLKFYREYAAANDNFRVIQAEHTFSVPVTNPSTGFVMRAIDPRDGIVKDVHARGTQDAIIQTDQGLYGILEHKSAVDIGESYFDKLDKDEQCTRYLWAGQREAEDHGLAYTRLHFVLYNAVRKTFPKPPTELKNGLFSIDRTNESTTIEMLEQFIKERNIGIVVANDEKRQNYMDYVRHAGDEQFIQRRLVTRNQHEILSCGERVWMEAMDMLDPNLRIYPNPTGDWACLKCPFRGPCIAKDDGSDWQQILNDNYELNKGR